MKKFLLFWFTAAFLFAFSATALAQQAKTVKVVNDTELQAALEDMRVGTIELAPGYYPSYNYTAPEGGATMKVHNAAFNADNGGVGTSDDCTVNSTAANYCFTAPSEQGIASAGLSGTTCTYTSDQGIWHTISSTPSGLYASFDDHFDNSNATFTVWAPGIYILAYSWPADSTGTPDYQAVNTWRFYSKPTVDLTMDASSCGTSITVNYSYDWGTTPQPGRTIQWQADGSNISAPVTIPNTGSGSSSFTYDFTSCGEHSIKVTFNQTLCGAVSDEAETYLYDEPSVTVTIGNDEICGLEASLSKTVTATCNNSNPIDGGWTVESGPAGGTATFTGDDVEVSECGEYVFRYTATNTVTGCDDYDEVTVKFFDTPVGGSAGSNDEVCGNIYTLGPVTPSVSCLNGGTLETTWSLVTGPGNVTFSGNTATVSQCGSYVFQYTAENGPCSATSTVTINYFDDALNVDAGDDGSVCGLEYNLDPTYTDPTCLNGGTVDETWTVVSGPVGYSATFTGNDVQVSVCGEYVFKFTVENGPCSEEDNVTVMFYDNPSNVGAGDDGSTCGLEYTLSPLVPTVNCGSVNTEWSMTAGKGTATFTGNDVEVSQCGTFTFTYTVTNGDCELTDDVVVKFYDTPVVDAGDNDEICGKEYTLDPSFTVDCENGGTATGAWITKSKPIGSTVTFTGDDVEVSECGEYIFRYTVTNGDCSAQDEVTIKFFEEPTNVTAGTNDEVCGLTTSLDQGYSLNCASLGTVETEWTYTGPSGATATLTLNGITEDTDVEVSECGEYTFTYWVDNGPCDPVSASVTIKFYNDPTGVVANTNTDDTNICIDGSYTLIPGFDTPACFGGDYTTSWSVTPATGTVVGNVFSATVCGEYTVTYTVDNGVCPEVTDSETIKVYEKPAGVTANTSSADKDICITDSYTLIPDYTTPGCFGVDYTTEWSVTPSTGTVVGDVFSATECGTYTIYYTVDNGVCDPVTATETINVYEVPSGVNANTNTDEKKICVDSEYTLMPFYNTPACFPGAYTTSWSVSPATGTVVGNVFSATACGEYTITYTVDNGICPPVEAYETIKVYEIPAGVTANTSLVTKEICLDGSYTLVPDYTTPGCYGNEYTTSWSVSPATATVSGNVFSATVCGEYTVSYTVDNGVCDPVTATETINVYDKADISFDAVPSSVCGYETSFYATFSVNCDYPATSDWSYTGPGTATITAGTGNAWDIEVSECGSYTFTFEVTNGPCVIDDDVTIEFYEIPNPDIDGDLDVFACSEVTYTVDDLRTCSSGTLNHVWSVTGGTIQGSNTGSSITVKWDVSLTSGTVSVTSSMVGNADCNDSDQITVDINAPTLAGQVKYFNGVYNGTTYTPIETYMPTPFATDISGTYPHDYFYVIVGRMVNNVFVPVSDTIKVEPYLDEIGGNLVEFMSYFSFDLTLDQGFDCDNEYVLKIWDGGLVYHSSVGQQTYAYNHTLGASYTYRNWGGGNATDALAIQLMVGNANDINGAPWNFSWVGAVTNPSSTPYGYYSRPIVDVNMSNSITALDALILNYRAVGLIAKFPDVGANQYSPDWKVTGRMVPSLPYITWPNPFYTSNVDDVPFNHSGADYLYFDDAVDHFYLSQPINWGGQNNFMNIYYTATGDINASYVPPAGGLKAEPTMVLDLEGEMTVQAGDIVNIPVTIDRSAELGAITLSMSYRKDLIEVLGTNYGPDFMNIDAENANVNIGWFSLEPNRVDAGDAIAYISVRVLAHIEKGTRLFELNANTELADAYAHVIEGVSLKSVAVFSGKKASELNVNNYPNPFSGKTTISYNLPEAGNVQIVVYNQIGQVVSTLMNEMKDAGSHTFDFNNSSLKPGVYQYRVTLTGASGEQSVVKRMIVVE